MERGRSDAFVVMTCNDISKLPPEFSRSERFDGVVFLDLPSTSEKAKIWQIYRAHYQLPEQQLPRTDDWTGAEIKSSCRLAALLGVSLTEAAKQVVPVAVTAAESVERLRSWASGRCLSASVPGLYLRTGGAREGAAGRRVTRAASN
jgi:SpoVK/Ycf46/Vps4 family AAA+-type ATPase